MNRLGLSGMLCGALFAVACGGAGSEPVATRAEPSPTSGERPMGGGMMQGGGMMMSDADCPMMVPSVQVETADVEGGAAVTFTTAAADRVDDLRSRVRRMASMMEARHGQGGTAGGGMHGGMEMMPPSHASVVDVDGGARLELHALQAADVDALRAHVRQHGESMRAGACPMMMMHGATTG